MQHLTPAPISSVEETDQAKKRRKRLERKAEKLSKQLVQFASLPDCALVSIELIRELSGRSLMSIRRDIVARRLSTPIHPGPNCARWPVGTVRAYLTGDTCKKPKRSWVASKKIASRAALKAGQQS
jgi:hypothetical protein